MRETALPPDADKPRVVVDYGGMQILDARENIRVVLKGKPPRGVRWCLKDAGFRPSERETVWNRPASPDAIFQAQNIGNTFFAQETP